jgi:AmpD protein
VSLVSRRARWHAGWWAGARAVVSPNFGRRPDGAQVSLVVLHSISLPPGEYGGDAVERLFTNTLDADTHPSFGGLRGLQVSAHFFLRRDGTLQQYVSCDARAWHAGVSRWRGRDNCNDYSIGIELEGLEGERFEVVQYERLVPLLRALQRRHGCLDIAGHEHVAPGRKGDPGPGFDWGLLRARLGWRSARFPGPTD